VEAQHTKASGHRRDTLTGELLAEHRSDAYL
jgi:hypothetical protein